MISHQRGLNYRSGQSKMRDNNDLTSNSLSRRKFLVATTGVLATVEAAAAAGHFADKNKMIKPDQSNKSIDFLANYSTTALESAIYLITGTHDNMILTRPGFARRTLGDKRLVGFAVTSTFSTDPDDARGRRENLDYWNFVFKQPGPKIALALDASREPGTGSSWGQLNAHFHRALGCRGVLTNGGVRDMDIIRNIEDFAVFSGHLTVAHGNPHWINFGEPVTLYGATFHSGDAVCIDEHGAIVVPVESLPHIEEAVAEASRRSKVIVDYCQSPHFNPTGLLEATQKVRPATPWKPSKKN